MFSNRHETDSKYRICIVIIIMTIDVLLQRPVFADDSDFLIFASLNILPPRTYNIWNTIIQCDIEKSIVVGLLRTHLACLRRGTGFVIDVCGGRTHKSIRIFRNITYWPAHEHNIIYIYIYILFALLLWSIYI